MKVEFLNSKGGTLAGYLFKPFGKAKSAIIFCHGFMWFKESFKMPARYLALRGFITLAFDFTGNGDSDGFLSEGTISQEVSDVGSAIKFLKKNYGVEKIGLVGHSVGGAVAVLAALKNPEVRCLVVLAPLAVLKNKPYKEFANMMADILDRKGLCEVVNCKRMRSLDTSFFRDIKKHNILKSARSLKTPVLVVHGDSDNIINIGEGKMLYDAVQTKKKKFYPIRGEGHSFAGSMASVAKVSLKWLKESLG